MLQYLSFVESEVIDLELNVISGSDSLKFFFKGAGYILLLIYSTIFIAAIDPFVKSSFELWTFIFGGTLTLILIIRFLNHIIKYMKHKNSRIIVHAESIELQKRDGNIQIPRDDIQYLKVDLFGNLIIRGNNDKSSFPLSLLSEEDRNSFFSDFKDMFPNRTEVFKKIWDFFEALLVAFILAMHIREFIIQAYYIPTGSMEDTLLVGDHLLVEKITYGSIIPKMLSMEKSIHLDFLGLRSIKRGDIIIFRPPNEEKKDFIKRCIAVSGDEFHIKGGYVYINGKRLEEPYVKGVTSYRGFSDKRIEGKVPEGKVIAMGDNRENSYDSRGFGYLPIERIKGRAFVLYWNTEQVKNLDFSRYGLIR
ncbi:MAG: signal peptidase I [Spirochaetota bacterium]|nr:signal peptidase I [Spirochaetota bacterium]